MERIETDCEWMVDETGLLLPGTLKVGFMAMIMRCAFKYLFTKSRFILFVWIIHAASRIISLYVFIMIHDK